MKKTIVICDKCGRELLEGEEVVRMDLDLCESCENELVNIVQMWADGESFVVNEENNYDLGNISNNVIDVEKYPKKEEKPVNDAIEKAKEIRRKAKEKKAHKDELVDESCARVLAELNGEEYEPETRQIGQKGTINWDKAIEMKQEGFKHEEIAKAVGTTLGVINHSIYKEMKRRGVKYGKN